MRNDEAYFCLTLTENEHYIVENEIETLSRIFGCKLVYYRKLKDGHVPMYREVKIKKEKKDGDLKTVVRGIERYYGEHIERNPYKDPLP